MDVLGIVWAKALQLIDVAAKLVVVGVPVLYFMGWIYLETYWQALGISDALLGFTTTDYLRHGAMVLLMSITRVSVWVLILALVCSLIMALLMTTRLVFLPRMFLAQRKLQAVKATQQRDARSRVLPKHRRLAQRLDAVIDALAGGAIAVLISFVFLLGLIVAGIQPSRMIAKEQAEEALKAFSRALLEEDDWLIAHLDSAGGRTALVVQCGGENCVLLIDKRMEVWPRAAVTRMETCGRVGRADDGTFHCIARMEILKPA